MNISIWHIQNTLNLLSKIILHSLLFNFRQTSLSSSICLNLNHFQSHIPLNTFPLNSLLKIVLWGLHRSHLLLFLEAPYLFLEPPNRIFGPFSFIFEFADLEEECVDTIGELNRSKEADFVDLGFEVIVVLGFGVDRFDILLNVPLNLFKLLLKLLLHCQ